MAFGKSLNAIAISAISVALLGACAVVQEKTIGESLDDTATGTQIEAILFANGGLPTFGDVDVEVADRLVLLAGRVPSEHARIEAERLAWTVTSVDEVANELVVAGRNVVRDVNDPWIAARIRARLLGDKSVKGVNYNIHVFDGTAYLLGFAATEDELRLAAQHASVVRGVKKVVSYVKLRDRIVPPEMLVGPAQLAQAAPGVLDGAPPAETQAAAPVVAPTRQPVKRGAYSDPYANGGQLPPTSGVSSAPLGPVAPAPGEFQ